MGGVHDTLLIVVRSCAVGRDHVRRHPNKVLDFVCKFAANFHENCFLSLADY